MVGIALDLLISKHLPFKIQHLIFDKFLNPFSLYHCSPATPLAGCSKSLSSKAAGESKPEAYPLGTLRISMS